MHRVTFLSKVNASVVDQDVDWPEFLLHYCDHLIRGLNIGEVGLIELRFPSAFLDFSGCVLSGWPYVDYRHGCPISG
jgi:hypothetical protein